MKTWKCISALAVLILAFTFSASAADVPNPAQKGPYEVGHTNFVVTDALRNSEIGGRPIAIYLWYPVDAASVNDLTPRASYPLDPY